MSTLLNYRNRLLGFNRNAKLFLASTVLSGLGLSLMILLYNLYILSLGFRQDMIGLVTAVASIVAVIAALPMGYVVHRIGYRWTQIIGMVGSGLSIALALLVPTATALIVTELIWGVAFTLAVIVSAPFVSENSTDAERPYLFSIQFAALTITSFIGNLFGGELPRIFGAWLHVGAETPGAYQGALAVAVAFMVASALPMFFVKVNRAQAAREHIPRPRLRVRNRAHVLRLLLPTAIGALGAGMFVPFTNVFWKISYSLSDDAIGQIFALSALIMTAVTVVAPVLTRHWGLVRVLSITRVFAVVGLFVFGFSPWFMLALAGFLGRDILMNLSRPLTDQFQMEQTAVEERAMVSSLSVMVFNLAWAAASWISGIWQTQGNFAWVFIASGGFYLLSVWLLHIFFGKSVAPTIEKVSAHSPLAFGTLAE